MSNTRFRRLSTNSTKLILSHWLILQGRRSKKRPKVSLISQARLSRIRNRQLKRLEKRDSKEKGRNKSRRHKKKESSRTRGTEKPNNKKKENKSSRESKKTTLSSKVVSPHKREILQKLEKTFQDLTLIERTLKEKLLSSETSFQHSLLSSQTRELT